MARQRIVSRRRIHDGLDAAGERLCRHVVNAIVRASARDAESAAELAQKLQERPFALARAQRFISASQESIRFREHLREVLGPFGVEQRFELIGPDILVGQELTVALTLLLHELATNAAKYGALTAPSGRVSLAWRVDERTVRIAWTESGGPPVHPPTRRGFGSRLL